MRALRKYALLFNIQRSFFIHTWASAIDTHFCRLLANVVHTYLQSEEEKRKKNRLLSMFSIKDGVSVGNVFFSYAVQHTFTRNLLMLCQALSLFTSKHTPNLLYFHEWKDKFGVYAWNCRCIHIWMQTFSEYNYGIWRIGVYAGCGFKSNGIENWIDWLSPGKKSLLLIFITDLNFAENSPFHLLETCR